MNWEKYLVLWRSGYFLALAAALPAAGAGLALLSDCSSAAGTIATIQAADPLEIRYSMAGDRQMCYAVSVTVDGKVMKGYMLGAAHPALAEFEREARTHVPEIPPAPAPVPAPAAAQSSLMAASQGTAASQGAAEAASGPKPEPAEEGPISLAGFRAVDWRGNRVDLSAMHAPNVVVYFWSPSARRVERTVDAMQNVYMTYRQRGVEVIGVVSGTNLTKFEQFVQQNEIGGAQILDSGQLASRYHVNPAKPFLVLDRQRKVIAAVSTPRELESILGPLAGRREIVIP